MSLSFTVTPGYNWPAGSKITLDRLRLTGLPSLMISGLMGAADIENNAVGATKLKTEAWLWGGSDTGTDTVVLTLTNAPAALADGLMVRWKSTSAKTAAATLNLNGLGAKKILRSNGTTLQTGDIQSSQIVGGVYDSAADSGTGAWMAVTHISALDFTKDWGYAGTATCESGNYDVTSDRDAANLVAGVQIRFKTCAASSAGHTLSINGGASNEIVRYNGDSLLGGEIGNDWVLTLCFDGQKWRLPAYVRRYISGQVSLPTAAGQCYYGHSFGRYPNRYGAYLFCVTDDLGYLSGDIIDLATVIAASSSTAYTAPSIYANLVYVGAIFQHQDIYVVKNVPTQYVKTKITNTGSWMMEFWAEIDI
jgi:hypothetical protein